METNNQPLVSVPVVTYNSAKYVLETLESIKAQTYQNIELIISDDCSTDNTVELCQKWIENNKDRFVRTQIITVNKNTGISANGNRGREACQGEWIKGIAGDDLMMPNCVKDCVEYAIQHNSKCLFGKIEAFGDDVEYANYLTNTFSNRNDEMSSLSSEDLYEMIADGSTPPAPAFFSNRQYFIENNITNDSRIPMIEDLPKWLNILKKGIKIDFLDNVIVKYRLSGISTGERWHKPELFLNKRKLYFYYQFENKYEKDKLETVESLINFEHNLYKQLYSMKQELISVRNSRAYRLGKLLLKPLNYIKSLFSK